MQLRASLCAAVTAAATLLIAVPTAFSAALPAPKPVLPANNAPVRYLPAFQWTPVAGVDHYEFEIAADAGFNAPVTNDKDDHFDTWNTRATLKIAIPNGDYWWRVRGVRKNGAPSKWSAPRSFKMAWNDVPAPLKPDDGGTVSFPQPATLVWSPVAGAKKYKVLLASDRALGSLVYKRTVVYTQATRFTPEVQLAPGTYYWSITPVDARDHEGVASPVWSFTWAWPSTMDAAAMTVEDLRPNEAAVMDPRFTWPRVPGAASYELEINSSSDFAASSKVCCASDTILGNTHAPTKILPQNTYYWRVRAVDSSQNAGVWNIPSNPAYRTVDTSFAQTAGIVTGLAIRNNTPSTADDDDDAGAAGVQTTTPIVVWDPVPGASRYQIDVVPRSGSTCFYGVVADDKWSVYTAIPSWTPLGAGRNTAAQPYSTPQDLTGDPKPMVAGKEYCLRVRPEMDRVGINEPLYGAYTYMNGVNGAAFQFTGFPSVPNTCGSMTPITMGSGDYFPPVPFASGIASRTPYFTWKSVAPSYFVLVSANQAFTNIVDYAFTTIPAYSPRDTTDPKAYKDESTSYYWAVLPAACANGLEAASEPTLQSPQSFLRQTPPPTLMTPVGSAAVSNQPVFQWSGAEGARRYRLQVDDDTTFSTSDFLEDVITTSTGYTSQETYEADTNMYWRVCPLDERLQQLTCSAVASFNRKLPAPAPSPTNISVSDGLPTWAWAPAVGAVSYELDIELPNGKRATFANNYSTASDPVEMTGTGKFRWRVRANYPTGLGTKTVPGPYSGLQDFTRTISEPNAARSVTKGGVVLEWEHRPGVKNYRVQISRTPTFKTTVETVDVDAPNYAPKMDKRDWQDGGTMYWRVAAMDLKANVGDYTAAQIIRMSSRMNVKPQGVAVRGKLSTIKVMVTTFDNKPIKKALVAISGAGLKPRGVRTNKKGFVIVKIKAPKKGTITFRATMKNFRTGVITMVVR